MPIDLTDTTQLETELEESAANVFRATNDPKSKPYFVVTRSNAPVDFQKVTPRIEIKCKVGQVTGHKCVRSSDNTTQFDEWRCEYAIQTVVSVTNDGVNAMPTEYVSGVREVMNLFAQKSSADTVNFPKLLLAEPLRDSGTNINTKAGDGFEYAAIGYSGIARIRDATAW